MELKYTVNDLSNYTNVRQVLKNEFNMSNRLITKLKQNKSIYLNNVETYLDKPLSINDIVNLRGISEITVDWISGMTSGAVMKIEGNSRRNTNEIKNLPF